MAQGTTPAQGRNPFSDPRAVLSDEGLYEVCMTGADGMTRLASQLRAQQQVLKKGLRNSGHSMAVASLVSRPLGLASDSLLEAAKWLRRTWGMAVRMLPELNGSGGGRRDSFTVKGGGTGGAG